MHDNLKYDKRQTWNWIESQMLNQLNTAEWNHNYFGKDLILHWDNCHFMVFWVSPGYSHVWHHSVLLVTSCRAIPWNVVASKASPYQFVFTEISVYGHVRWPISTIKSVRYVYSMFWYFIVHSLVCIWLKHSWISAIYTDLLSKFHLCCIQHHLSVPVFINKQLLGVNVCI